MKNLRIVFIIAFAWFSITQVVAQTSITKTKRGDTTIEFRVDTSNNMIGLRKDYVRKEDVVNSFSKHFIAKTVPPGDKTSRAYKQFITKANGLAGNAKVQALKNLKDYPSRLAATELKNVDEINECTFLPIPVYYLTHNVASYTNETNLTSFFNLDTVNITYKITKNNRVFGIVQYQKGRCFFWHFLGFYSRGYRQILAMNREPLIFVKKIAEPTFLTTNQYDGFGYVSRGHIIFVTCAEGEYTTTEPGAKTNHVNYGKRYTLQSAEAFYLGSDSTLPSLNRIIKNEQNRIEKDTKK